ncbi:DNA primase [Leucobacter weissii]|uniref:DNA primase n=1 Tax=Leucobacter weissii TaxID=1983706 RepID=A0A939SB53_9MICO|nr:DNA primase [Leucobacter weissii]MBO1902637.1 DNA primase [Leucobacter weissii]
MAGRIRASDVEEVKSRTNLADLVGDYVSLKNAGVDSMKGLCPFHDERSPSFHVRPALGYYHCFGCGESGDAISFLQRMDHLTFAEAVERLAARINYVLTYEEGGDRRQQDGPNRARLLTANQAAAAFFVEQFAGEEAERARSFLAERAFDAEACARFGVGYAPRGWEGLSKHLTAQGFTRQELVAAGLVSEGQRGVYDRFRGRILWPIRDTSGQTIGFGARKLYDDDNGPKYLNTPETPVYRKAQVLYGLDLAKKAISRGHRAVVVEGYTDVMACHLAGEEAAVATCGTAFGKEHITVLRRIMGDDAAAEVVFTFDPDEAGQKAALRAFAEEKRFSAQTYVAVAPDGLDPADLRLRRGDEAVRELFTRKVPLFAFALRQAVGRFDLNSVEGRVSALRAAAPIIAEIKDPAVRPGYTRELARMLGTELAEVQQAVRAAAARGSAPGPPPPAPRAASGAQPDPAAPAAPRIGLSSLPDHPSVRLERDALMAMLQEGPRVGAELMAQAVTAEIGDPSLRVARDAVAGALPGLDQPGWFERVLAATPESHRGLVRELGLAPMPVPRQNPERLAGYARGVVVSLLDRDLLALKNELVARMQRVGDPGDPGSRRIQEQLTALESARRALRVD